MIKRQVKIAIYKWLRDNFTIAPLGVDSWGIWFLYKRDEVCWMWPSLRWRYGRNPNTITLLPNRYYSLLCDSTFLSLKNLDERWDEYEAWRDNQVKHEHTSEELNEH